MINRPIWKNKVVLAWKTVPLVWLTGVRRSGKTTLAKSFPEALYMNCDLQDVEHALEKPEAFFAGVQKPLVILDEVHQLSDPSRVLKVGADAFPHLKILATGSSTLAATKKFRDSLTGRKRSVELAPILHSELSAFGIADLRVRLFRGGLPPALLVPEYDPGFYAEWLDSYFSRDVQELFSVGKRSGFLKLFELLMRQSGGLAEVTSLTKLSGMTRPTVASYLDIFEITHVIHVVRPFHGGGRQEIVKQPKIYAFDTGFVCYIRGWRDVREDDGGHLWEHLVLDALRARPEPNKVYYWRDKNKREVDFVIDAGPDGVIAIECKWNPEEFEPQAINALRQLHPNGKNFIVSPFITQAYEKNVGALRTHVVSLAQLMEHLALT